MRSVRLLTAALLVLAVCTCMIGWQLKREGEWSNELERRVFDSEMEILKLKRIIRHGEGIDFIQPGDLRT